MRGRATLDAPSLEHDDPAWRARPLKRVTCDGNDFLFNGNADKKAA